MGHSLIAQTLDMDHGDRGRDLPNGRRRVEIVGLGDQPRPDVITHVESFGEVLDVGRAGPATAKVVAGQKRAYLRQGLQELGSGYVLSRSAGDDAPSLSEAPPSGLHPVSLRSFRQANQ